MSQNTPFYTSTYPSYSHNYSNVSVSAGGTGSYYINSATNNGTWSNALTATSAGHLELTGKGADIKVNGESLMSTLQEIKEYLRMPNIVKRDATLESEFEELRLAGERYESLLKEYKEKRKVWDILKTDV
jgi:hypothetical protein